MNNRLLLFKIVVLEYILLYIFRWFFLSNFDFEQKNYIMDFQLVAPSSYLNLKL